jgi:hypothetical protein
MGFKKNLKADFIGSKKVAKEFMRDGKKKLAKKKK